MRTARSSSCREGKFSLNFPLGYGPGPEPHQLDTWVWAWTRSPSTWPLGVGLDQIPLNFPLGCGPGPDCPQLSPCLWAWTRSPSTSPLLVGLDQIPLNSPLGCGPGPDPPPKQAPPPGTEFLTHASQNITGKNNTSILPADIQNECLYRLIASYYGLLTNCTFCRNPQTSYKQHVWLILNTVFTVNNSSCGKILFFRCLSVHRRGGGGASKAGGMHGRGACMAEGHAWQRGVWQGACMAWSVCGRGICMAGEMATAADSTHLAGMHSCFRCKLTSS